MIVSATTGQYDDSIEYSAWDLAADGWWEELGYSAQIVGGRVLYELAGNQGGELVRLGRLDTSQGAPHSIYRYVKADTRMRLVKEESSKSRKQPQTSPER